MQLVCLPWCRSMPAFSVSIHFPERSVLLLSLLHSRALFTYFLQFLCMYCIVFGLTNTILSSIPSTFMRNKVFCFPSVFCSFVRSFHRTLWAGLWSLRCTRQLTIIMQQHLIWRMAKSFLVHRFFPRWQCVCVFRYI